MLKVSIHFRLAKLYLLWRSAFLRVGQFRYLLSERVRVSFTRPGRQTRTAVTEEQPRASDQPAQQYSENSYIFLVHGPVLSFSDLQLNLQAYVISLNVRLHRVFRKKLMNKSPNC